MKIIDLAEKQYNNEVLPKHIRYENEDLYFDGVTYYDKEGNNDLFDILAMNYSALTHLFDEVEIIEEPNKINKIRIDYNSINIDKAFETGTTTFFREKDIEIFQCLSSKINELIDEVNKLKGDKNEK